DKPGTLMLALYDNSMDYENSVKREKRSEDGVVAGLEVFVEPQEVSQFTLDIPDGSYAIALFIEACKSYTPFNKDYRID
ncbi:DUF2141 domain-containing protein, partial [Gammaproteobacteria bacterium]|nr:DUF2141 domain-containing protein [Gammaproteobacteria bacterium]